MDADDPLAEMTDPFDFEYEPWGLPAQEPEHCNFKTQDGIRLHYVHWRAEGDAPVVLMLHGRRAHARWFDPVVAGLWPRYECASLDSRNHGDSEDGGPIDLDRYAADLAQFMDLFSGRKRILLAHSMAGRVAILARQNHGIQPDLLVMADTPLARRPHHFRPEPPFRNKEYPDRDHALQRFRLMPPGTSADPELLRYIAELALRENENGTWSWKFSEEGSRRPDGFKMPDWSELRIEEVTCPTLVIYGEHSMLVDAEDAVATARRFPRGKALALPGAYHHLMLDRPQAFNEALLTFFRENGT